MREYKNRQVTEYGVTHITCNKCSARVEAARWEGMRCAVAGAENNILGPLHYDFDLCIDCTADLIDGLEIEPLIDTEF